MTLRKREGAKNTKHYIALYGDLALEWAMDLSEDRLWNDEPEKVDYNKAQFMSFIVNGEIIQSVKPNESTQKLQSYFVFSHPSC
jgi:hypothetical protein